MPRIEVTRRSFQNGIAWIGLALVAISIAWLGVLPWHGPGTGAPPLREARPPGAIKCVIIDAGHGGQDSGAIQAGVQEKDLTLDVARRVEWLLRAQGLRTVLTREGDEAVSLAQRATLANRQRDGVFVSIHFNEGGRSAAMGVQTFYATRQLSNLGLVATWLPFLQQISTAPANLESQSLAAFVQKSLVGRTQAFDRGTHAEQFYVVAHVRHPAVLVEGGFLSNREEMAKLVTEGYRQQLAEAISEGVMRYRDVAGQQSAVAGPEEPRT
ncbi:MAG: N-acetylmuramoyl-L-alanine amidase family protein [Chthoniobacterales bacterium]